MTGPQHSTRLSADDVFIYTTRDGSNTIFSRPFDATYHSINGAVAESRHVCIEHGLNTLLQKKAINILEFGFGSGLNALLAFLFARKHGIQVNYIGIEQFLLPGKMVDQLDYPAYLAAPEANDIFLKMHELKPFESGLFSFDIFSNLLQVNGEKEFDCIFFDAFSPGVQPELWSAAVFDQLYKITSVGGCLVTYCAQGQVRRDMKQAGYKVEQLRGAPGKREMLRAVR